MSGEDTGRPDGAPTRRPGRHDAGGSGSTGACGEGHGV